MRNNSETFHIGTVIESEDYKSIAVWETEEEKG